jgi:drug/metabolite transporter (DMT)-like permease|tara:strand:+ start:816 stop:1838 length:1023 start_codon:yes stop_codon:yes gene_type:complete
VSSNVADQRDAASPPGQTGPPSPPTIDLRRRPLDLKAGVFVFFVSTLWSGNSIAIKAGLDYAPALRLGWMRFVVGSIVILIWALYTGADLRIRRSEWRPLISLSVFLAVQIMLMNLGIKYSTAGHATVLIVTSSIWVAVLSHYFIPGDRLEPIRLAGIMIAYLGIIVLSADSLRAPGGENMILGDILSAISGFLLGARLVYSARLLASIDPAKMLLFQAGIGSVAFVIISAIFEPNPWLWTWELAASLVYQGVVIAGFGFLSMMLMHKHFFPSRVSAISLTQPVTGILLAWLILDEDPTSLLWIGGVLVMGGALLAQKRASSIAPMPSSEKSSTGGVVQA